MKNNSIDYGVVAYENSIGGIVEETKLALQGVKYKVIDKISIPIHQSVFKKKDVPLSDIKYIASHIQAIKQTQNTINKMFKNIKIIET